MSKTEIILEPIIDLDKEFPGLGDEVEALVAESELPPFDETTFEADVAEIEQIPSRNLEVYDTVGDGRGKKRLAPEFLLTIVHR